MCEGEAGSKHVAILTVRKDKTFKIEPLELKTVRLMHFETIKLSECNEDVSNSKKTQEFIRKQLEYILSNLSLKYSGKFQIILNNEHYFIIQIIINILLVCHSY